MPWYTCNLTAIQERRWLRIGLGRIAAPVAQLGNYPRNLISVESIPFLRFSINLFESKCRARHSSICSSSEYTTFYNNFFSIFIFIFVYNILTISWPLNNWQHYIGNTASINNSILANSGRETGLTVSRADSAAKVPAASMMVGNLGKEIENGFSLFFQFFFHAQNIVVVVVVFESDS